MTFEKLQKEVRKAIYESDSSYSDEDIAYFIDKAKESLEFEVYEYKLTKAMDDVIREKLKEFVLTNQED